MLLTNNVYNADNAALKNCLRFKPEYNYLEYTYASVLTPNYLQMINNY